MSTAASSVLQLVLAYCNCYDAADMTQAMQMLQVLHLVVIGRQDFIEAYRSCSLYIQPLCMDTECSAGQWMAAMLGQQDECMVPPTQAGVPAHK